MRGHSFLRLGERTNALDDFTVAIRLEPRSAAAYSNRAKAYVDAQEFHLAIADYEKAVELNASDRGAKNELDLLRAPSKSRMEK